MLQQEHARRVLRMDDSSMALDGLDDELSTIRQLLERVRDGKNVDVDIYHEFPTDFSIRGVITPTVALALYLLLLLLFRLMRVY